MLDSRDPAIKLFGKTIPLPEDPGISPCPDSAPGEEKLPEAEASMLDPPAESDQNEPANASGLDNSNEDDHQIPNGDAKPEQDRAEPDTSDQEKVLKKPDKIIPCPRCTSMDTKFCYFNNYNVNQPRHFCKNCQRYWTAGGTMRNVPVGAGRRKSKHSAPHHRHIMMIPDGLPCTSLDAPDPACQEAPEISLGEEKREIELGSCGETKNEPTCVSSVTASHSMEDDGNERQSTNQESHNGVGPMNHLPCYPGPPFVFPWGPIPAPWSTPPVFASPPFCSPTVAFPFMPASFWGMSTWPTGTWNVPWVGSNNHHLSPLVPARNERPILGKHTRGGGLDGEEEGEKKSLWVPKTLRIDDPDEAAKSSIWATLGIKPEKAIKKGGIFKAFQSKTETKEQTKENAHALHANPAAMCRSQTFQEST